MSDLNEFFFWNKDKITFRRGETIGVALAKAGIRDLGPGPDGTRRHLFCGIGQCQGCLVFINGDRPMEACQTPATNGLMVSSEVGAES